MADVRIETKRSGTYGSHPLESDLAHMHPLVSWRSILGGLLVSLLSLAILLSLGMAFGGVGLEDSTTPQRAGVFTGVWFLVSAIISLFLGSYFAARISKFHTNRIGSAQGPVIASLFFGFFLWQSLSALGWAANTAGSAVGGAASAVGQGASQAAQSPAVTNVAQNIVEDAIGDLNLRSEPQVVATGVASRLMRGDTEAAKNYLARQAGIPPAQADQRIAQLRTRVDENMNQARVTAANAMQATGWSLFATLLLGTAAAVGGGALGSRANLRKPLTREQFVAATDYGPATI